MGGRRVNARQAMRGVVFAYGLLAYYFAVRTMLYLIGFVTNTLVPKSIDSGPAGSPTAALVVDAGLLLAFGLTHSLLARRTVKTWLFRRLPAPVERSTYTLTSGLTLAALIWVWRPMPVVVLAATSGMERAALTGLSFAGWALAICASYTLGHFELYGVRHAYAYARGREYTPSGLLTGSLYSYFRHPMYLGFLVGIWATPQLTQGHLLFAGGMTGYVLLGVLLEERDLHARHGEAYREYQERVPGLMPARLS